MVITTLRHSARDHKTYLPQTYKSTYRVASKTAIFGNTSSTKKFGFLGVGQILGMDFDTDGLRDQSRSRGGMKIQRRFFWVVFLAKGSPNVRSSLRFESESENYEEPSVCELRAELK